MEVQISQWGNSLGIRVPKNFAKTLGLKPRGKANMVLKNNALIITAKESQPQNIFERISDQAEAELKNLCDQITPENWHGEYFDGGLMGQEVFEDEE